MTYSQIFNLDPKLMEFDKRQYLPLKVKWKCLECNAEQTIDFDHERYLVHGKPYEVYYCADCDRSFKEPQVTVEMIAIRMMVTSEYKVEISKFGTLRTTKKAEKKPTVDVGQVWKWKRPKIGIHLWQIHNVHQEQQVAKMHSIEGPSMEILVTYDWLFRFAELQGGVGYLDLQNHKEDTK